MQLNIRELDDNFDDNFESYNNELMESQFEKIPENIIPVKVIKKGVRFEEPIKPIHKPIPRENAKIVRPQMPPPKPKISYEDILSKMGMFVSDGKLHLVDKNSIQQHHQEQQLNQTQIPNQQSFSGPGQNNYIYDKYFKEELHPQNTIRRPRTIQEYKRMLVADFIQRERIKQMKSTKLLLPTSNINISPGNYSNMNKLFSFSKR
jgi:hypothetical protein